MGEIAVSELEARDAMRWQIFADDTPNGSEHLWPGSECLMTTVRIQAAGIEDTWGFGGPKLYPGERVRSGYSRVDGLPVFVLVRFDPSVETVHIETTRRTLAVSAAELPVHFGLKFLATPLSREEELVAVYGDESERSPIPALPRADLSGTGYLPLPD